MALAYLLSPTFEIVNSAGKPATGGFIEVYVAGSRNKYYCASDFDGTLHPFRIPLDSLGSNIVLAEDTGAYDVYVYNRYGTLLMSRYNVKPGGGGTLAGTITSSDGSISVTPTSTGVDLRVDLEAPSILRATAQSLTGDGLFQFSELQRDGRGATVDVNGRIILSEGWWHYDATVRLRWPGNPAESGTQSISLYTANGSDSMPFDLSYAHSDTVQINGEFKSATSGTQFILGVLGIPAGLTVELVDFGIHSILGEGAANGRYYAGNGIQINEADRVISVDFDDVQAKLTAGTGITIDENNVISATVAEIYTVEYTSTIVEGTALFDDAYAAYLAGKTLVVKNGDFTGTLCRYSSAYGLLFAIMQPNLSGSGSTAVTDGVVKYMWLYKYGTQSRWGNSGLKLLPRSYAADAGKVLMVNPEYPTSHPIWQELPAQQQADWTQSDSTAVDYIRNKPDLSAYATDAELTAGLATKQDVISDLSTIRSGADAGATAVQPGDLATVATTGAYSDLSGTPDLSVYATTSDLTTGLSTKQDTINDLATIRSGAAAGATAVQPGDLATVATTGAYGDLSGTPDLSIYAQTSSLATVATTGDYADLSNTPSIPVIGTITL